MVEATRTEHDSMGSIEVPASAHWGAQTQRSLQNFSLGEELMPAAIVQALAQIKAAVAAYLRDHTTDEVQTSRWNCIYEAATEVAQGAYTDDFPLHVWQTGSGTQTNMNVNEVIAHLAQELAQQQRLVIGDKPIHPNDDVNRGQSSNDVFPSALHLASLQQTHELLPALRGLIEALQALAAAYPELVSPGRTHFQDAVPLRFADQVRGWIGLLVQAQAQIESMLEPLSELALGGTAVGTGLNALPGLASGVCERLSEVYGWRVVPSDNPFAELSGKQALAGLHGALKVLAAALMKLANDVRILSSGPRNGIGELVIPANEPGSSIMPGKVNPTQCEALTMVAAQVMGNDVTVGLAASQGILQLNVYMPVLGYNVLQSLRLLRDACESFTQRCVVGMRPNEQAMAQALDQSIMMVTALTPELGYEEAARIAKLAFTTNRTLTEVLREQTQLTPERIAELLDPQHMV